MAVTSGIKVPPTAAEIEAILQELAKIAKSAPPGKKSNAVVGTDGDDVLVGTKNIDSFSGGAGIDKLSFANDGGPNGIAVSLEAGQLIDTHGHTETVTGVEIVVGTKKDDYMFGSKDADYLVGGAGNDILAGGAGFDEFYGGEGTDWLYGGDGSDYFVGGKGNDHFDGGNGFDLVDFSDEGGLNGVTVSLATGKVVDSYGGLDTFVNIERVRGTDYADTLTGNAGNNMFEGGGGDDKLVGDAGDDVLWAGFGNDTVDGGAGDDQLSGGRGDDAIDGGAGIDTVDYGADGGWLGVSVNLANGLAEDAWGTVDKLKNVENVTGTSLNDWMMGDANANVLAGMGGNDTLAGGAGADVFVFGPNDGADRINDFSVREDKLDLRGFAFGSVEEVVKHAVGDDLGMKLDFGARGSVTLVDVNLADAGALGFILA